MNHNDQSDNAIADHAHGPWPYKFRCVFEAMTEVRMRHYHRHSGLTCQEESLLFTMAMHLGEWRTIKELVPFTKQSRASVFRNLKSLRAKLPDLERYMVQEPVPETWDDLWGYPR